MLESSRNHHRVIRIECGLVLFSASLFPLISSSGCAGDPTFSSAGRNSGLADQTALAASMMGATVRFHHDDFYSLTIPKAETNCAGDAKTFFYPFDLSSGQPVPMPTNRIDETTTLKPSFIKNVSVDLTDANAPVSSNLAASCSLGTEGGVPPVSNCATFDYGAINGVPSDMGGSFLLIGGIQGYNYSGHFPSSTPVFKGHAVSCGITVTSSPYANSCSASMYALGVEDSLSSLSGWANYSSVSSYRGPSGVAGAAATYNPDAQKLVIFGGSSPLTSTQSPAPGSGNYDTWFYDLKTQQWNRFNSAFQLNSTLGRTLDLFSSSPTVVYQISKNPLGRSIFGYVAAPGMAVQGFTSNGLVASATVDQTDRIVILGGDQPNFNIYSTSYKFNPTYGPEFQDAQSSTSHPRQANNDSNSPTQWLDSYHTQILYNGLAGSLLIPAYIAATDQGANFGATALYNATSKSGYLLTAGGFRAYPTRTDNSAAACGGTLDSCGSLMIQYKYSSTTPATAGSATDIRTAGEIYTAPLIGLTNWNTPSGPKNSPALWTKYTEAGGRTIPWFGGVNLLPGFDLSTNEAVYFGGASCFGYVTEGATGCSFTNTGRYWRFSATPVPAVAPANLDTATHLTAVSIDSGSAPTNAGMASARGLDGSGNVIIVAWGGMKDAGSGTSTVDTSGRVYYLYQSGSTRNWTYTTPSFSPSPVANGALVFSHVTRKFYLFGGHLPLANTPSNVTWELTPTGSCTSGGCTFTWTRLEPSCYPECPSARRSHRMVEVNYYNRNPTAEPSCTTASQPCSFGIFMEGGTTDGTAHFADRWMFDPTANAGRGHWQKMGELPPRNLSALASANYSVPSLNRTGRRAILFGGETGLQNPTMASDASGSTQYFVAPTLGDTWMYDFDNDTWNRVTLLGKGYNGAVPTTISAFEQRQGYNAASPTSTASDTPAATVVLNENTPPALSGAVMITRTQLGATTGSSAAAPLKIPEIYLIGGREKSGSFMTLNKIYKFCAGSTGENTTLNDGTCDAYDATTNSSSPSPVSDYVGRWLRKSPSGSGITPSSASSFLGAGTYDPVRDRIILTGGIQGSTTVTDRTTISTTMASIPYVNVYEYTPASKSVTPATQAQTEGQWTSVPNCTGYTAPTNRYGHQLGYDTLNRQLVMTGGYDSTGAPLTQTVTLGGTSYTSPEVWIGKRIDATVAAGTIPNVPEISGTVPCYYWRKISSFSGSSSIIGQTPPASGLSHAAGVYIPSTGYNTGYYSLMDHSCEKAGPFATGDASVNKLLAGGVYIDLNRGEMGATENVLLNLTYIPLGVKNVRPDAKQLSKSEVAVFKIHLVKTGQTMESLISVPQPRYMTYAATDQYPQVAQSLSILAPPDGQIRQEQILIPLSMDPGIDRIRIERYSGSGILIDATILRMGRR